MSGCAVVVVEELVPEDLWQRVEPLLPARAPRRSRYPGRLPVDDRAALAGIVFVLKTGITRPASLPPRWLYGDRGYDYDHHRATLRDMGIIPRIARKNTAHGSGLGKARWVVDQTFAWLHQFKRLRNRWERRADIHLSLMHLACVLICYRKLPTSF